MSSAGHPMGGSGLCSCLSCQCVTGISKLSFEAVLGETGGDGCATGPGCTADPHAQRLLWAHWPRQRLNCFHRPTTQAGGNRRKQSHGKSGLILIKVTKVNVTFGCQEESSGISLFNINVMRAVALEICIAVFLQTVPSSNLLEIGFCGAEQFVCSR